MSGSDFCFIRPYFNYFNLLSSEGDIPPSNGTGYSTYAGAWKDMDEKYVAIKYMNYLGWNKIGLPNNKYF